jgi:carboxyl-terminal processing protease
LLLVLLCSAAQIRAQDKIEAATVSAADRAWIASKIYSSIQSYFAHWEAIPGFDLDREYHEYLEKVMGSDDRLQFDLASMEFMAKLQNGHSDFHDDWPFHHLGEPVGFVSSEIQGQWVVTRSQLDVLKVGDVLKAIDGRPAGDFFKELEKYVPASDEIARRGALFYFPFLFPVSFKVTLEDGKKIQVDRKQQMLKPVPAPAFEARMLEGDIGYLQIPSFGNPENEERAIAFLKEHAGMKGLIIDVRLNGGGNTPRHLIGSLMERPYKNWNESTSLSIGLFAAYAQIASHASDYGIDAESKAYMEAFEDYFSRPNFFVPGSVVQPDHPIYAGPIFVLAGEGCASACEDFLMPLKTTGRATIIGQKTQGTSGQPFLYNFGNGMLFRVSSKRMYLPDGSQFEGLGIQPDVKINRTITDWKGGKDPEFDRALELAKQQ